MSYEPLHHKYRPQTFANLVGQEAITTTLINAIRTERIAPAYLFTGPRGTGKTSSARILAKSLNCLSSNAPTEEPCGVCEVCQSIAKGSALDVIEIDAASNTGVDNIREIIERTQFAPVQCRYKVYIIDEVHMLSSAAFNALLKTLEEPPARVIFVLATTDPQRVLPTIISRCQRFDFRRIPLEAMVSHLGAIASQENINIAPDAVTLVAQVAQGGLRDAESLLDQLSLLAGQVTVEAVWDLVGAVPERDLLELSKAIDSDNPETVIHQCRRLMDRGREPLIVLQNLASFYRDLLIAKTAPNRSDLVAVTPPTWNELREFVKQLDVPSILLSSQHLKNSEAQIKNTTQPRLWLEVTLLGLLPSANLPQLREQENPTSKIQGASYSGATPRNPAPQNPKFTQLPASAINTSIPTVSQTPSQVEPAQASQASPPAPAHREQRLTPPTVSQPPQSLPAESPVNAQPASLEKVWQDVLARVQPFTQGLLQTKGCLLAFDGSVARVSISSQPLLKIAQSKLSEIEAAFEAIYKSKVKVSLQAGATASSNTTPAVSDRKTPFAQEAVNPNPEVLAANEPTAQNTVTIPTPQTEPPTTHYSPTSVTKPVPSEINQRNRGRQEENVLPSSGQTDNRIASSPVNVQPYPTPNGAASLTSKLAVDMGRGNSASLAFSEPSTPASKPDEVESERQSDVFTKAPGGLNQSPLPSSAQEREWQADEIEKALGNLKQFFEGEIIDLIDDREAVATLGASFELSEPVITQPLELEEVIDAATDQLEPEPEEDDCEVLATQEGWEKRNLIESPTPNPAQSDTELEDWQDDDEIPF